VVVLQDEELANSDQQCPGLLFPLQFYLDEIIYIRLVCHLLIYVNFLCRVELLLFGAGPAAGGQGDPGASGAGGGVVA
jgi:hypothetical protein